VLACVLHVGDRFRCWKRMLCGMKFSVIAIYHTVGLGCEGTLLDVFFLGGGRRRKVFSPQTRRSWGSALGTRSQYRVLVQAPVDEGR